MAFQLEGGGPPGYAYVVKTIYRKIEHENGFSPVWIRKCRFIAPDPENDLSQIEHENGFSPVWIRVWRLKLPDWVNDLSQIEHL